MEGWLQDNNATFLDYDRAFPPTGRRRICILECRCVRHSWVRSDVVEFNTKYILLIVCKSLKLFRAASVWLESAAYVLRETEAMRLR